MEVAELNVNQSIYIQSENMEMQRLTDFNKTECVQRIQIVQGLWSLGTKGHSQLSVGSLSHRSLVILSFCHHQMLSKNGVTFHGFYQSEIPKIT